MPQRDKVWFWKISKKLIKSWKKCDFIIRKTEKEWQTRLSVGWGPLQQCVISSCNVCVVFHPPLPLPLNRTPPCTYLNKRQRRALLFDLTASNRWVANSTGKCITVPDSPSLAFGNQAAIMAGLRDIVCPLLTHKIPSTRQYMLRLTGLKKVRTQSAGSTPLVAPRFPAPCPSHLLTTLGRQHKFWRFLFRKRDLFLYLYCKNLVFFFWFLDLQKVGKEIRMKYYFPGHFDGFAQVLRALAWLIPNFIPMIQISPKHKEYCIWYGLGTGQW